MMTGPASGARASWWLPTPHPAVTVAAIVGIVVGLWPGSLPRTAVVTAVVVAASVALATIAARIASCGCARRSTARPSTPGRRSALIVVAVVTAVAVTSHLWWQNAVRTALDAPSVGAGYWCLVSASAMTTFVVAAGIPARTAITSTVVMAAIAALLVNPGPAPAATGGARPRTCHSAPDCDSQAADLTRDWVGAGGLGRTAVVIAVPTGSGWVDPQATTAIGDRFGTGVTILSLNYADTSSWKVFVTDRDAAGRSAIAVLRQVLDARDRLPEGHQRPDVYLYGQSLGALGAEDAREWADHARPGALAGTALAGVPADTIAVEVHGTPRTVVANASDPVTRWSVRSIWHPVAEPRDTRQVGRSAPRPPWAPIASFVAASADLLVSLDGPAGTGHRYDREQVQSIGPRAAS